MSSSDARVVAGCLRVHGYRVHQIDPLRFFPVEMYELLITLTIKKISRLKFKPAKILVAINFSRHEF